MLELLYLAVRVPLPTPHHQLPLEAVGVVDAVARGQDNTCGYQRGSAHVDIHIALQQQVVTPS